MTEESTVDFGDQVTDPMTGFKGTVIAITQWMYGCRRVTVQPKGLNKDGELFDTQQFDEPQLKVTKAAKTPAAVKKRRAKTGGPRPEIKRAEISGR